jgi:nucleoside-diphosphate-sugar epimerase
MWIRGAHLTTALLELGHQVRVIDAMWFGNHLPDHENLEIIEVRHQESGGVLFRRS